MNTKTLLTTVAMTFASLSRAETFTCIPNNANTNAAITASTEHLQAGKTISIAEIKKNGLEHYFCKKTIDSQLFARIYGKSYKTNCTLPRTELRYLQLLHYTADGRIMTGEMICHKDVADDLTDIFRKLFEAKYPIENMQLIDNYGADDIRSMEYNNTTCFNYRTVAGSKKLSNHSLGKAVDINPLYNPYVKRRKDGTYKVSPEKGRQYADRTKTFKYKIDRNDLAYRLFKQHGFRWGGDYRSLKDYQHFEKEDRI